MTVVENVKAGILNGVAVAEKLGMTIPVPSGKLLRPITSFSFVSPERQSKLDENFWLGCLAIQMVHEASIIHDDVFDGGLERRNQATLLAKKGIGTSVLVGDLYLTGAYRIAALTGYDEFLNQFIVAIETMVRGETIQNSDDPVEDHLAKYEQVVRLKSGQLFGIAAALPSWSGNCDHSPKQLQKIGIDLGILYQLVDDFLDYCPTGHTGKPKLQDFNNRVWTFVLGSHGTEWFDQPPNQAISEFFSSEKQQSMAETALCLIEERGSALLDQIQKLDAQPAMIEIIEKWIDRCGLASHSNGLDNSNSHSQNSLNHKSAQLSVASQIATRAQKLGPVSEWSSFFQRNSLSFSFASRLFPSEERSLITGIYLFCRFTDNLVDKECKSIRHAYETLNVWDEIARSAYEGHSTTIKVADVVMSRMAQMEIPYQLVSELIEGMRMDVEPPTYASMADLKIYTYRVASVVGDWITQAFGVTEPWVLERAHDLGHAMQLTNIIRDVGEDLDMGRIYLPTDYMRTYNFTPESLYELKKDADASGIVTADYIFLLEKMILEANLSYDRAYEGIPYLPSRLRHAIAVAARVYRGIHEEVRTNKYNNLSHRAHTSSMKKILLARKGITKLRQVSQNINQSNIYESAS